jgi:hypothetical protein
MVTGIFSPSFALKFSLKVGSWNLERLICEGLGMRIQVGYSERNAPPLRLFFNNFLYSLGPGSFIFSTVLSFFSCYFLDFFYDYFFLVLSLFLLIEMALLELLLGTITW